MGCSSCQQNNHIVPTTTVATSQTYCECACGCEEPVCPTPQPCTEITDSKCIIYTGDPIKCGLTTVVTTNASVATALSQIVNFFCTEVGDLITEDILCGTDIVVPANTTFADAVALVVTYFCEELGNITKEIDNLSDVVDQWIEQVSIDIQNLQECCESNTQINALQGEQIAALQECCASNTETNAVQAEQIAALQTQVNNIVPQYKFVHQETSVFDNDTITITRQALEYCNALPLACSTDAGFVDQFCDLHVSVYYYFGGNWIKIPQKPFGISGTEGYSLMINSSGDITIVLAIAPISPAVPVRVVILA